MRIPVALALASVLTLSACSGDDSNDETSPKEAAEAYAKTDPEQIQDDSNAALADVESLRVAGEFGSGAQSVELDLAMDDDDNCSGTVTYPNAPAIEVLQVGDDAWFKAPDDFWTTADPANGGQIASVINGRWVVATADFSDLFEFCDFEGITEDDEEDEAAELKVEGVDEIDGVHVVEVSYEREGQAGTAYVAGEEPHYPIRLVLEDQADLTYSDFDEPVDAEAPDDDDIIDLSTL